jgi:hypothetical protein
LYISTKPIAFLALTSARIHLMPFILRKLQIF